MKRRCMNVSGMLLTLTMTSAWGEAAENSPSLYTERYRPRYHFTADEGWLNDPNGLVFVGGVYHLFFQHERPETRWGHATSADLLHWKQQPDAVVPEDEHQVFSGSAVIDSNNTSGFQRGTTPPVVAIFTSWGEGQCLAYSNDEGKNWTRYENNPVLRLPGDTAKSWALSARDPHVMWDEANRRWVMILYSNPEQRGDKKGSGFSLFTSPDLKTWTKRSHLPGFYVCPDVFQLPIEGETGRTSWIAMDWSQYTTGTFDGSTFTPRAKVRKLDYGSNLSANQSWKHLPDGRVVQICWLRGGKYPGMPFNQQMSFPTELTLRRVGGELRLCKNPIREISSLYGDQRSLQKRNLAPTDQIALDLPAQSYDLSIDLELIDDAALTLGILGQTVTVQRRRIKALGTEVQLAEPLSHIRILADLTSIEVFANHGEITMSYCVIPPDQPAGISITASGDTTRILRAVVNEVNAIWSPAICQGPSRSGVLGASRSRRDTTQVSY